MTIDAPFELVWSIWRKSYRRLWDRKPPAKKASSMSLDSSHYEGDTEIVKVWVQFGPRAWESSCVRVTAKAKEDWAERQSELQHPKKYWVSQASMDRKKLVVIWESFEKWVASCDEAPGDVEIGLRLLEVFQKMKSAVKGLERAAMIAWYLALHHSDYLERATPASEAVVCVLIDMMAVLDLYRECRAHERASVGAGYEGSPRSAWEEKNELVSAEARREFAKARMIHYGFLSGD